MPNIKRKCQAYHNAFKIHVIEFTESSNNCAAECEFGVSEKLVRNWRKSKIQIGKGTSSMKRTVIRISPFDDLEKDLLEWILELRQNGFAVTRNAIHLKAQQLAKNAKYRIDATSFKSSMGWCTHFMNHNNLTLHERTHIAQKLPSDLDDKVLSFHKFVVRMTRFPV